MSEPRGSGPSPLLAQLAQPSRTYLRGVWLAAASLSLFLVLYFLLAGWFLVTFYQLTLGAETSDLGAVVAGVCALLLAVFMLKGVFFIRRGGSAGRIEVTRAEQPRLFTFLDELADRAQAPRPHKVFLSPQVNAAVFYDVSPLNLIIPSKKNIEIGLALVNVLSLGEFRAVVAHEFGHVTQRSMVVGQWASMAETVAGALVARRDKLDAFLNALSRFDIRVAWVGWLLSLIVWSIRSLVDTAFGLVVRLQRALSREMEFHADLVAVSVTGSDAIIHALLRLQAADDSWARTRGFVFGRQAQKKVVRDAFTLHVLMQTHMEEILNDLDFGRVPSVPADHPAEHRVFKTALGQPPQMWVTHPSNSDRESNAKRHYVAAPIEQGSAWALFENPDQVREQMTALLLQSKEAQTPESMAESVTALHRQMNREFLDRRYRGVYLGRSVVRAAARPEALVGPPPADWRETLDRLYPEDLIADVTSWRRLSQEVDQLQALQSGALQPAGGLIRYGGENIAVKALPRLIDRVDQEARAVEQRLLAGDQTCRSVHRAAAAALGNGWDQYLSGLLAVLHYADHTLANLDDLHGQLAHTVRVVTATGRVGEAGRQRVIDVANELHRALGEVYGEYGGSRVVTLDPLLTERLHIESWDAYVGRYTLAPPDSKNLASWLNVIDGWTDQARGPFSNLSEAALEQLLLTEAALANHVRSGTTPEPAPAPSRVPDRYDVLVAGEERKRDARLTWWQRVQIGQGVVPTIVRFAIAAGIVIAVLGFGQSVNTATVTVYNGLALPVEVRLGGHHLTLRARSTQSVAVRPHGTLDVETHAARGPVIEKFSVPIPGSLGHWVYDVAGGAPLVEWTAIYGPGQLAAPPSVLGNPRWSKTSADFTFEDPPSRIETSGGGDTRLVLASLDGLNPERQLDLLKSDSDRVRLVAAHARWDLTTSRDILYWLDAAARMTDMHSMLAQRLSEAPNDIVLLRARQDAASDAERAAQCDRDQQRSAAAPENGDLRYVALRCIADPAARLVATREGLRRWPKNGWFAYAVGYGDAEAARWPEAIAALEQVPRAVPPLADAVAVDLARIHRVLDDVPADTVAALAKTSRFLTWLLSMESGQGADSADLAYGALARGHIDSALALARQDTAMEARIVRLAAASDGASPEVMARAFALAPNAGVDDYTRWSCIGLAVRVGRPFTQFVDSSTKERKHATEQILRFVDRARRGGDLRGADSALSGLPPVLRGEAYSSAVIVLGREAPEPWRRAAKQLLFAPERPYFR